MTAAVSLPTMPPTSSTAETFSPHLRPTPPSESPAPSLVAPIRHGSDGARSSSASPPISPTSSGSSVVPQYPFSVALPYIPGSNANLSGYFSNANNQPLPDDSDVQTRLPSICVDYLSHDWTEDDIWTSWKAMTKHKADLANGVRLENASWRTWAKQRSKLRTISPETLNWLKDSDVTWLYGPLHTAVDPVPPAKAATMEDRLNLDPQTKARHAANPLAVTAQHDVRARAARATAPTKPILKHRSLSDILSVPTHRHRQIDLDEEEDSDGATVSPDRPPISHTRSDTVVPGTARRVSPPAPAVRASPEPRPAGGRSPSERSIGSADEVDHPRKHISFNHFVEQCIAVDSEDDSGRSYNSDTSSTSEDDEDDDDALSFRSSPRSHAFPLAKVHTPLHLDKEPHTIAKLAPTVLKSSEMVYPSPCPAVVFNGQILTGTPALVPDSRPHAAAASPYQQISGWSDRSPSVSVASQAGSQHPASQWDDDEELGAVGFDYFGESADFGIGDEYNNAGSNGVATQSHRRRAPEAIVVDPTSPTLSTATEIKAANRSVLKARALGSDSNLSASPPKSPSLPNSYAAAAAAGANGVNIPGPSVPRGRSISRGSSSSSLDRSASADGRRSTSSPVIDGERGRSTGVSRSGLRASSSTSSLNDLGSSPSRSSSGSTIPAPSHNDDHLAHLGTSPLASSSAGPSSASSSSASLSAGMTPPTPSPEATPGLPQEVDAADADPGPSVPRVDSVDFEKEPALLFGSPAMPSSPSSSSAALPRTSSFSALHAVRWSDDDPSPARRALLRAQARGGSGEAVRRSSSDGGLPADDYGLSYASFDDDDRSGVISRAVDIAGTARDLVGALFNVAFRRT